ncbi:lipopolysaccharide heptosyltransferase II [Prosthecomicrobium pneumaticum]|uniref:lipopolysaccharide heptosyltransferase II n=1 Tax=Prosthecomicrobium pneumaticum TaxID=81895 RepID=A0A7W9L285_9HYPH|nr:heptosyltransferase-2 [Prosthecomicrobium pneumaticum]
MTDRQARASEGDGAILVVPFQWIGDFVRAHTAVRILTARFPGRPIDMVASPLCAPLTRFMPELRAAVVEPHVRGRLSLAAAFRFARRLRDRHYRAAIIMPGTVKAALAPFLAGIPRRTGWRGEMRYGLVNDMRSGEFDHIHIGMRCAMLAMPPMEREPVDLPPPRLEVSAADLAAWRRRTGIAEDGPPIIAIAPGSNGPERRWPLERYVALAAAAAAAGFEVWVMGGPSERTMAATIRAALIPAAAERLRDFTDTDLADAVYQAAAADVFVGNDSGLLHLAAATGTPCVAIYLASFHDRTGPFNANVLPLRDEPQGHGPLSPAEVFARARALIPAATVTVPS